jgi:predicted Zn-dependent peptidase
MPDRIRQLAEEITLADLLCSPSTVCDAISLMSNILSNAWIYTDLKTPDDINLERDIFAVSQAYDGEPRRAAFEHLRQRRQFKTPYHAR